MEYFFSCVLGFPHDKKIPCFRKNRNNVRKKIPCKHIFESNMLKQLQISKDLFSIIPLSVSKIPE